MSLHTKAQLVAEMMRSCGEVGMPEHEAGKAAFWNRLRDLEIELLQNRCKQTSVKHGQCRYPETHSGPCRMVKS